MKFFATTIVGLIATLRLTKLVAAQGGCAVNSGGPGADTINSLKTMMFNNFLGDSHCFPAVDSVSGTPSDDGGHWCGHCNGYFMAIFNRGGYEFCATSGDIDTVLSGANLDGNSCSYPVGTDTNMALQYSDDGDSPENVGATWLTCTDQC